MKEDDEKNFFRFFSSSQWWQKNEWTVQYNIRYKIYSKTLIVRNYIKNFSIILVVVKVFFTQFLSFSKCQQI